MSEEIKWSERGGVIYTNTKGQTVVLVGNTSRVLKQGKQI